MSEADITVDVTVDREGVNPPTEAERAASLRESEIAKLRAIADFFEANPELEIPWTNTRIDMWVASKEEMKAWSDALPGKKDKNYGDTYFLLNGELPVFASVVGFPGEPAVVAKVSVLANRNSVCNRIVTGTELKEVEEEVTPAVKAKVMKEVEIVEWQCDPLLDD